MGDPDPPSFRENDLHLLESGNFADGVVKCQGRTWKVHKVLLASRLKFFKVAFYGSFSEATSAEVNFPEADPDSVDFMLRHLYGEALNVETLKTPVLCVRCWKLADYVQLETLKTAAISSLEDHLDAMALLLSSDLGDKNSKFKWLQHFFDALREVQATESTKPFQRILVAFIWVTRFEISTLPRFWIAMRDFRDVNNELIRMLIFHDAKEEIHWIPDISRSRIDIHSRSTINLPNSFFCSGCRKKVTSNEEPRFYNPFPVRHMNKNIGQMIWCKECVIRLNENRAWPWRLSGGTGEKNKKVKVEAWSWSDDE